VCDSTLRKMANVGDWVGACAQLDRWNKAGGRVVRGLVYRRADERAVCEGRVTQ
jgi:lysozyme